MTSEIAVLNKNAVVLAADSAVTLTNEKIFNTANKIFTLSKYHPVGIMIYSNASFMGISWEIIIKKCRKQLRKTKFDTIKEYADYFIQFVNNFELIDDECVSEFINNKINTYFEGLKEEFETPLLSENQQKFIEGNPEFKNIRDLKLNFKDNIKSLKDSIEQSEDIEYDFPTNKNDFIVDYGQDIQSKIDDIFSLQNNESINMLIDISYYLFTKQQFMDNSLEAGTGTGIVITGFGDKEYYPGLVSITIDGKFNDNLRYEIDIEDVITNEFEKSAMVFPFAQTEEVKTFFEGVKSKYQEEIEEDMEYILRTIPDKVQDFLLTNQVNFDKDLFRDELLKEFENYVDELSKYRYFRNTIPKLLMISHLQKEELAIFAKTLISLTSFTRKYSFDAETVGGPIDVAVISKFDGFIWIDRKYYFKKKFNPQFKKNYYRK